MGKTEIRLFDVRVVNQTRILTRDDPTANLQAARNRKEEEDRAWDIYANCIYHNRRIRMADECRRYNCRLAELISTKKGEPYAATISWIRTKVSFAIFRGALLCLRGSRTLRRRQFASIRNNDLESKNGLAGLS